MLLQNQVCLTLESLPASCLPAWSSQVLSSQASLLSPYLFPRSCVSRWGCWLEFCYKNNSLLCDKVPDTAGPLASLAHAHLMPVMLPSDPGSPCNRKHSHTWPDAPSWKSLLADLICSKALAVWILTTPKCASPARLTPDSGLHNQLLTCPCPVV